MSFNVNLNTPPSGPVTLTPLTTIYYFNPAGNNLSYTYTLPAITCDGMIFKIIRNDSFYGTTLTVTGSNNIVYGGNTTASVSVGVQKSLYIISYNSLWYVTRFSARQLSSSKTIFSGCYTANNSNPYNLYNGSGGTEVFIAGFSYLGSSVETITGGAFYTQRIGGTGTYFFTLRDGAGNLLASSTTSSAVGIVYFTTIGPSAPPTGTSILYCYIAVSGNNTNKIGLCSFIIY